MSEKEKKRLIDSLTKARLATRATLDDVDLDMVVYKDTGWRVRDLVGHIATWDWEITKSIRAFLAGSEYLTPDLDAEEVEFNQNAVLEKQKLSKQEVLNDYETAYDEFKKAIQEIPDDRFPGDLLYPWGDERGDIATMVEYMIEHSDEHREEILNTLQK